MKFLRSVEDIVILYDEFGNKDYIGENVIKLDKDSL